MWTFVSTSFSQGSRISGSGRNSDVHVFEYEREFRYFQEVRVTLELCKRKGGCVTGKKGKKGKKGKMTKSKKTKGPYVLRKNGKVIHSFQTFDKGRKKFRSLKETCINNGFIC